MSLTLAHGFPSYLDLHCALSSTPGLGRKNMAKSVDSVVGTPLCPGNLHSRQFPGEMRWESTWGGGCQLPETGLQFPMFPAAFGRSFCRLDSQGFLGLVVLISLGPRGSLEGFVKC